MQTYDEILKAMTDKYTEATSIVPSEYSDIGIRMRILAGEIYSSLVNFNWLKEQVFVNTATGEYLDMHADMRGISRQKAHKASGKLKFYIAEPSEKDILVPKGTVAACPVSLIRFVTLSDAVIKAGNLSVSVGAEAMFAGKASNVPANSVTVMITPPAGVVGVTNNSAFAGGCDIERDESLRARVINSIRYPVNSTNIAYYKAVAESVDGVASASVVPRSRGAGTVDVYIAADGSEVNNDTLSDAQKLISQMREVCVDVTVKKAKAQNIDLYISLNVAAGYDFDKVKSDCIDKISDYIYSCGAGGEVLICKVSECLNHVEGVESFNFLEGTGVDTRCTSGYFPIPGDISFARGSI